MGLLAEDRHTTSWSHIVFDALYIVPPSKNETWGEVVYFQERLTRDGSQLGNRKNGAVAHSWHAMSTTSLSMLDLNGFLL